MLSASNTITSIICTILLIYTFVLLVRVILFYVRPPIAGPARTLYTLVLDVTDPVLRPIGRMIQPVQAGGMAIDLAPMILFVILLVLRMALC